MKLAASGGGTGGHVYPALTVLDVFRAPKPVESRLPTLAEADMLWIGSSDGMEQALVSRAGIPYAGVPAGGFRGMGARVKLANLVRTVSSVGAARGLLSALGPDVMLVTGGYASVSATLAARTLRVPVVLYLPDIVPGQAVKLLSHLAARVAVTSGESGRYLGWKKLEVTGYPVRAEVFSLDRERAHKMLGLDPRQPTLLVLGGSRGARSINRALVGGLGRVLAACQVLHVSGHVDSDWVEAARQMLPAELRGRYIHFPYLHEMAVALGAADLVVARAGAATLGEFPAAGLPSILVPYPHAGQHQQPNADHLVRHGAAQCLADRDLENRLVDAVLALLGNDEKLGEMARAARAMAQPQAATSIAALLCSVAETSHASRHTARPARQRVR